MKTLTLTQPYATLIAVGAKKIETRSWSTSYRGELAIHAAKGFPYEARDICKSEPFRSVLLTAGIRFIWGKWRAPGQSGQSDFPLGAVVAICRLEACYRVPLSGGRLHHGHLGLTLPPEEPERSFGNYAPGRFAWLLEDVRRLVEPIPARGALSLWEWEPPEDLASLLETP
jgi:activating signal cointegrator 1